MSTDPDRRAVLKRLGTAAAASVAASRIGTAQFADETTGVLETLADENVLARGSVAELSLAPHTPGEHAAGREGVAAFELDGHRWIVAHRDVSAGRLRVYRSPTAGRAYAVVETDDDLTVYTADGVRSDVTTASTCDSRCTTFECKSDGELLYLYTEVDGT